MLANESLYICKVNNKLCMFSEENRNLLKKLEIPPACELLEAHCADASERELNALVRVFFSFISKAFSGLRSLHS